MELEELVDWELRPRCAVGVERKVWVRVREMKLELELELDADVASLLVVAEERYCPSRHRIELLQAAWVEVLVSVTGLLSLPSPSYR